MHIVEKDMILACMRAQLSIICIGSGVSTPKRFNFDLIYNHI